jgi:hypothetical protein
LTGLQFFSCSRANLAIAKIEAQISHRRDVTVSRFRLAIVAEAKPIAELICCIIGEEKENRQRRKCKRRELRMNDPDRKKWPSIKSPDEILKLLEEKLAKHI